MTRKTIAIGIACIALILVFWLAWPNRQSRTATSPTAPDSPAAEESQDLRTGTSRAGGDEAGRPASDENPSDTEVLRRRAEGRSAADAAESGFSDWDRTRQVRIAGYVFSSYDGDPISNVLVRLTDDKAGTRQEVASGKDGHFLLLASNGVYQLYIRHPDYRAAGINSLVAQTDRTDLRFELIPVWRVSGRVRDALGETIAGAGVWLKPQGEEQRFSSRMSTDEQGRFLFERGVVAGPYEIGASHARLKSPPPSTLNVPEELEIDLVLQPADLDRLSRISGHVRDDQGTPVPGVRIIAGSDDDSTALANAFTDASGRYQIDALRPGSVTLNCLPDGFSHADRQIQLSGGDYRVDFSVLATEDFQGRIVDEGRNPVAKAIIHLREARLGAFSDQNGTFYWKEIPPGHYRLTVEASDFMPFATELSFPHPAQHEFTLRKGLVLRGAVSRIDGSSVAKFLMVLSRRSDNATLKWGRFDSPDGRFEITGLAPGDYTISMKVEEMQYQAPLHLESDAEVLLLLNPADPRAPLTIVGGQ